MLFTWVKLATSSALQSRKWQLIGMSQWYLSALCPLPALTDNWTRTMQLADTLPPQSATLSLHPVAYNMWAHFPSHWGQEAELAWAHSMLATCSRLLAVDRVWVEPTTSWLRVRYSTNWTTAPTVALFDIPCDYVFILHTYIHNNLYSALCRQYWVHVESEALIHFLTPYCFLYDLGD